jgi:SAM-dependent methyltransferase
MDFSQAAAYGERHADVYDQIYGARFPPQAAVEALVEAAGTGRVLELGAGTGRLAIPLIARGIEVDGIEASPAMVAKLRARPGGHRVGIAQVDLADFDLARHDYMVAVCAVSTLFMLSHEAQRSCIRAVARHLSPGGRLFIEAFQPDPSRFDRAGYRVEQRPELPGAEHVVRSSHDNAGRAIHITHELADESHVEHYTVDLCYATLDELDAMAAAAGLRLTSRWQDWTKTPAQPESADPISIYQR